jgi:hypothetical protein
MHEQEKRMVFEHLPLLLVDMSAQQEINALCQISSKEIAAHHRCTHTRPTIDKHDGSTHRPAKLNANPTGMEVQDVYFPLLFALHLTASVLTPISHFQVTKF